jgi:hypothetical protein
VGKAFHPFPQPSQPEPQLPADSPKKVSVYAECVVNGVITAASASRQIALSPREQRQ